MADSGQEEPFAEDQAASALWCSSLPLDSLKVGHEFGKLFAYFQPPGGLARVPSSHVKVGRVPPSGQLKG